MLWFLLPIAIVLIILAALLPGWLRARAGLKAFYAAPLTYRTVDGPPVPAGEKGETADAELRALGYTSGGWMAPEDGSVFFRVYTHAELPIYALVAHAADASGVYAAVPQMESFLPGGGRLSTTGSAGFARFAGAFSTGAPRLVQLRAFGPVTGTALDGQHAGTVRAWISGGRSFLPANAEELIVCLQEDHCRSRAALEAGGGLSFLEFLKTFAGRPSGVLRF